SYGQYPAKSEKCPNTINSWSIKEEYRNCNQDEACFNYAFQKQFYHQKGVHVKDENDCLIKCSLASVYAKFGKINFYRNSIPMDDEDAFYHSIQNATHTVLNFHKLEQIDA